MSGKEGSKRKRPGKKGGSKKRRVEDVILEPVVNENNNNAEVIIPVQAFVNENYDAGYETPTNQGVTPIEKPFVIRRGLVPNSRQNNDDSNLEFP